MTDHYHVGLDSEGRPVLLFESVAEARRAVECDSPPRYESITGYWADVPVIHK